LQKFGLIPEFVGRLPVVATVPKLDAHALEQILTEPRNALTKQFRRLFELDGVELVFTQAAIAAIAQIALQRGTGARALRAILEETLLDAMFNVPSHSEVARVIVDDPVVRHEADPTFLTRAELAERGELTA
jgi:ATP-dependent Clp protease ATP-binding subunit ClpX